MPECTNPHPEFPDVPCQIKSANHQRCTGLGPGGYVDWINPRYRSPQRADRSRTSRELREMASRVPAPTRAGTAATAPAEGFPAGLAGSERAATRWDEAQKKIVDDAIVIVAAKHAGGGTFTADAVWAALDGAVPVTKGLTARLIAAEREGTIENTGETAISERGGEHDHGQRLTLWRSLA